MKEKSRPTNQLLYLSLDKFIQYIKRLGRSEQYAGFYNLYVPALLLLIITGTDSSTENFYETEDTLLKSTRMWRETDGLPKK